MKRTLSYLVGIIGAVMASTAFAQTTANGPYYATPSWDQQLPATTRFIVLANWASAAVLDRETGLVWEKVPSTPTFNWVDASIHCVQLNLGGRKGWRLPTIQDLASLVDDAQSNPALPSGHPFTISSFESSFYWSATAAAGAPGTTDAWGVFFNVGGVGVLDKTTGFRRHVWCVRGGQGVDTQ